MLREFAPRAQVVRGIDLACRIGGEIVVVMPERHGRCGTVAERLRRRSQLSRL